jgi:hypothetical protein
MRHEILLGELGHHDWKRGNTGDRGNSGKCLSRGESSLKMKLPTSKVYSSFESPLGGVRIRYHDAPILLTEKDGPRH